MTFTTDDGGEPVVYDICKFPETGGVGLG